MDDHGCGVMASEVVAGVPTNVTIPKAMVGDTVTSRFIKRDHRTNVAQLEEIHEPSPDRIPAPCPHADLCGGCLWQNMEYGAQVKLKAQLINRAFEKAGHEERISKLTPSESQFQHRNRMDFAVGWKGEIGLKEYGAWNRYIDLTTCLVIRDGAGDILRHVREWMHEHDLQPWDAKFYTGDIRYVVIRDGQRTNQRHITIVVKSFERITEVAEKSLVKHLDACATSILVGEQALTTDISLAQNFHTLKGEEYLEEMINDIRYRIYPNSFFQTNPRMAEVLQSHVLRHIASDHVLDLYCGLGFFSLAIASQRPNAIVHGVELDEFAIKLASQNAELNNVAHQCTFTAEKSESLTWTQIDADTIIVDPPRAGLHPKVIQALIAKKPKRLIYVSCSVQRLVEELKHFKTAYNIVSLEAFDLFPHTPHAEVVCVMDVIQ